MNRVFAAAVGAFVACIIALQFGGGFLATTLSLIAGGAVAWVGYDLRGFALGVARAFSETSARFANWHPDWQRLRYDLGMAFWFSLCIVTDAVTFLSLGIVRSYRDLRIAVILYAFGLLVICGLMSFAAVTSSRSRTAQVAKDGYIEMRRDVIRYGNPVALVIWTLRLLYKAIPMIPPAAQVSWKFLRLAFAYTHNAERKICFLDAVIGGAVGIYFHNPLVGAVAGGVVGALHAPFTQAIAKRIVSSRELELAAKATAATATQQ